MVLAPHGSSDRFFDSHQRDLTIRKNHAPLLHLPFAEITKDQVIAHASMPFTVTVTDLCRNCTMALRRGDVLPLNRGAAGKVLNAFAAGMPAAAAAPLLYTSFGERDPLCGALAAPVFGPAGILLGALSLSGPLERFSDLAVQRMNSVLFTAAENATRSLGGQWPAEANRLAG